MLHDVLGQLGQVGEVDFALPHRGLGRAQLAGQKRGAGSQQKQDGAVVPGLSEADRAGALLSPGGHLSAEQRERRPGSREQRRAHAGEHRDAADRYQQEEREAAFRAATRVHEQGNRHDIGDYRQVSRYRGA